MHKFNIHRIGILSSPRISPNENAVLFNLGRMLQREFDLHLLCSKNIKNYNLSNLYSIHSTKSYKKDFGDFRYLISVCNHYVKKLNLNLLINICSPATVGFMAIIYAKMYGIPSVIRMTGDSFQEACLNQHPWEKAKSWVLHRQLAMFAYKKADFILAIGENLKKTLIANGINSKKISVLPQPFDPSLFKPSEKKTKITKKIELGIDPNRKTILFVGRLSWLKGVDRIIKIIELIQKRSSSFQFCLLGQGELAHELKRFPPSLVQMPGLVAHRDVSQYYQAADLLIFPSRTEGLPNTILEALSCKLPVIASPVGDIPNWVSTLATDPRDYVDYLIKGDYALDDLPDHLNFDHLKKSYTDLFQTVIREFA